MEDPKFIRSSSLRKSIVQPEEEEGGVDGLNSFPKFSDKFKRDRNANHFRYMEKGHINLPSIGWQVNLRSY